MLSAAVGAAKRLIQQILIAAVFLRSLFILTFS